MEPYALCIAWDWEFDRDFVVGLERECRSHGIPVYLISPQNIATAVRDLRSGEIWFSMFLDRASDTDERFEPIARLSRESSTRVINPYDEVERAKDKATMHLEFITNGLFVPYTIIVSPYNKKRELELSLSELAHLGRPFIIKPANTTGGGVGVVTGAETLKDVIDARQHHKNDKYLLQETIRPALLGGNRAWFRALYVFGDIFLCWWDDITHIYREITALEESQYGLSALSSTMNKVHDVCRLDFFSSEIAFTEKQQFVVVDYVNEICDMRIQSRHPDGVPDAIVARIQERIVLEASALFDGDSRRQ